jgi:TRAP-type C4-dicarboxylate transport system permease small subunit
MSHVFVEEGRKPVPAGLPAVLVPLARLLGWLNRRLVGASMLALLAACLILTGSVFLRYFLKAPTDWQDEVSVFLLVGAIFFCGAYVQSQRGHVGIEAFGGLLPPAVNRWRILINDLVSLAFCAFFSWKSWTLFMEAVHEGQTTSSSWASPLWIPYGIMSIGMTLLALELLLQGIAGFARIVGPGKVKA